MHIIDSKRLTRNKKQAIKFTQFYVQFKPFTKALLRNLGLSILQHLYMFTVVQQSHFKKLERTKRFTQVKGWSIYSSVYLFL